jgi:uroporphyrinogen-III synthase
MLLLVTRPLPDAEDTARRLRGLGHAVLVQPFLRIVFAPPPRDLAEPAALIVTSRNALRAVQAWPQAVRWRSRPVFVVGKATAREAAALGFTDVRVGGGDAAVLAETVRDDLAPEAGPLIYPAARQRTGGLSEALEADGYEVVAVETYRAEAVTQLDEPVRRALFEQRLDGVLLYSRRTAEAFRTAVANAGLRESLADLTCYVLSPDVGEALAGTGAEISAPERPEEDLLLVLIGQGA